MRQLEAKAGNGQLRITPNPTAHESIASHQYLVTGFDTTNNRAARAMGFVPRFQNLNIIFESDTPGFRQEIPNGVSVDALLAVVVDHLSSKQLGMNASVEQSAALDYLESARELLRAGKAHGFGGDRFDGLSSIRPPTGTL